MKGGVPCTVPSPSHLASLILLCWNFFLLKMKYIGKKEKRKANRKTQQEDVMFLCGCIFFLGCWCLSPFWIQYKSLNKKKKKIRPDGVQFQPHHNSREFFLARLGTHFTMKRNSIQTGRMSPHDNL